ncbi:MAG: kynureninase [Gammaproteobacteria bacterium]|nr:kynureninase [Gammaproteobacteria bacterium]
MTDFAKTKSLFHLPQGMVYLDGNSLGPLPKAAVDRVATMMRDEWGEMLITAWNRADWINQPSRVGDRIGRLIGARAGSVVMGDTLSIKVYQALASALEINAGRNIILSDSGNFPTDLYMADGLIKSLDKGHELKLCEPAEIEDMLSEQVAVLMLTEVDYRSGRLHDMRALTAKAHEMGILTIWDLAHSAGALPVDVGAADADFAVGCSYKYLNSGPGGPAFIYVAPRLASQVRPALSGWLGHEAPFAFDLDYRPGAGIERMRVGTPPVLQLTALEAALDVWDLVDMNDLRARSIELSSLFIELVEASCPDLELASPRDAGRRGSQVSFRFEQGYAAMQALIERGVIGDFRAPDIMRFGFTPLYVDAEDVRNAAAIIAEVMLGRLWDRKAYFERSSVT